MSSTLAMWSLKCFCDNQVGLFGSKLKYRSRAKDTQKLVLKMYHIQITC